MSSTAVRDTTAVGPRSSDVPGFRGQTTDRFVTAPAARAARAPRPAVRSRA